MGGFTNAGTESSSDVEDASKDLTLSFPFFFLGAKAGSGFFKAVRAAARFFFHRKYP